MKKTIKSILCIAMIAFMVFTAANVRVGGSRPHPVRNLNGLSFFNIFALAPFGARASGASQQKY